LFQIGLTAFVNHFVKVWITCNQQVGNNSGPQIHKILSLCIPSKVADSLISQTLQTYIQMLKCDTGQELPDICLFLQSIIVPQLNVLDLSKLICLGVNHNEHFENVVVSTLHSLRSLVRISLRTHGRDITLPICTNHILEVIGRNCPKLKSIDVSYNSCVNDVGLKYLVPCSKSLGCPLIEELFVYECDVTLEGMAYILRALPNIHLIGYKETGLAIMHLHMQLTRSNRCLKKGLKLTHINNVGNISNQKGLCAYKLQFSEKIVNAVRTLCPHLCNLKVRVADDDVPRFEHFQSLSSLELIYNIGKPGSPGKGTEFFLKLHGAQLNSLAIICDVLHEKEITILEENCCHLKHLWLRCNHFVLYDLEMQHTNLLSKCKFFTLESLYFHIGETEESTSILPLSVVQSILCNTDRLEELKLVARSVSISDDWLNQLLLSVNTTLLKNLLIALPGRNKIHGGIDLCMSSVHLIINCTPLLQRLGNLSVWNIRPEEVHKLQSQLEAMNFDLNIIY
jgi:hypothetical protein